MAILSIKWNNKMNHIQAMRAFVRVVESLSFHKSAEQLGIPRSTLSKRISDLEQHYAVKLLHRSTRTVMPTAEGQAYYLQAVRLLAEFDELEQQMHDKHRVLKGHLRVDMPMLFAEQLFIPKLPDFYQRYPKIKLTLGISDRAVNIAQDGVDCVIRIGEVYDQTLIGRKFADFDFVTCASPAYLDEYGVPQTPSELENHRLIGYFSDISGTRPLCFPQTEINQFHYSANGANGIVAMLKAGLGIGQPLRALVQTWLDSGELVEILADYPRPSLPAYLLTHERKQSARLRAFSDWVWERFAYQR